MKIRTRYAPSPTGFFHIGGARTAIFNYLFAKHNNGDFIVRIEDTDIKRNVENGVKSQINGLNWLKIYPDESPYNEGKYGPYTQSEKKEIYQKLAHKLIEEKKAYYCFCTQDELLKNRNESIKNNFAPKYNRKCLNLTNEQIKKNLNKKMPYVIRLKINDYSTIEWIDLIRGKISVPTDSLTDPAILKSNGLPMYNFAVIVDDYYMKITHVLRGEEHISNTPYQIAIKTALNYTEYDIKYGHLPIIINEHGKKLSKRDETIKQFINDYQTLGYPAQAIVNFLALIGWTSANNDEIIDLQKLIKKFDITRISKAPAMYDIKKLNWISNQYIKKMTDNEYIDFISKFLKITVNFTKNINLLLLTFKNQISYGDEINSLITNTFLSCNFSTFPKYINDLIKNDLFKKNILLLEKILLKINDLTSANDVTDIINTIKNETNLKGRELYLPIRYIAIGQEHGPEMDKILLIVGKKKIIENISIIKKKLKW